MRESLGSEFSCSVIKFSEGVAVAAGLPKDPRGPYSSVLLNQTHLTGPCQRFHRVVFILFLTTVKQDEAAYRLCGITAKRKAFLCGSCWERSGRSLCRKVKGLCKVTQRAG